MQKRHVNIAPANSRHRSRTGAASASSLAGQTSPQPTLAPSRLRRKLRASPLRFRAIPRNLRLRTAFSQARGAGACVFRKASADLFFQLLLQGQRRSALPEKRPHCPSLRLFFASGKGLFGRRRQTTSRGGDGGWREGDWRRRLGRRKESKVRCLADTPRLAAFSATRSLPPSSSVSPAASPVYGLGFIVADTRNRSPGSWRGPDAAAFRRALESRCLADFEVRCGRTGSFAAPLERCLAAASSGASFLRQREGLATSVDRRASRAAAADALRLAKTKASALGSQRSVAALLKGAAAHEGVTPRKACSAPSGRTPSPVSAAAGTPRLLLRLGQPRGAGSP